MKKLLTVICMLLVVLCARAEKAAFIAGGYSYTRKADSKILITDPAVDKGFTIPGVATFTMIKGAGSKQPTVAGNKMILNLNNEIIITNADGVKINTVKIRYATSPYGQNTQINWDADNRNSNKQFSRNKGSGETGTNIRTQEYVSASENVRLIAKGELHLSFVEIEYTLSATSAVGGVYSDDDSTPVEYYNIQGIRVRPDALLPGIYICRQGNRITKILIR